MTSAPRLARALECPACGAEIFAASVVESQQIASCRNCQKVIDLAQPRGKATAAAEPAPPAAALATAPSLTPASPAPRQRVPLPAGMSADEAPGRLTLTWKPSLERLRVAGMAVPSGAIVLAMLATKGRLTDPATLGFLAALGLFGAYALAAALVNRVRIIAAHKAIKVSVGPLPWPGSRATRRGEVQQLFVEAHQEPDRDGRAVVRSYILSAVLGPDGHRVQLVRHLDSPEQALWLEQTLERALGVRHTKVGGELDTEAPPPSLRA